MEKISNVSGIKLALLILAHFLEVYFYALVTVIAFGIVKIASKILASIIKLKAHVMMKLNVFGIQHAKLIHVIIFLLENLVMLNQNVFSTKI